MFRQETLNKRVANKGKRTDRENKKRLKTKEKNRKRNCTVAFRMTEEENDILNEKVKLSGLLKQEYLTEAALNHEVVFVGDRKVFIVMKDNLDRIENCLKEIDPKIDEKDMEILKTIIEMLESLYKK